jgi:hypothetical protein
MIYRAYLRKEEWEYARICLMAAVTTMDVLVALNKNYRIDVTKTFTPYHAEENDPKGLLHKTETHKQFWKKGGIMPIEKAIDIIKFAMLTKNAKNEIVITDMFQFSIACTVLSQHLNEEQIKELLQ